MGYLLALSRSAGPSFLPIHTSTFSHREHTPTSIDKATENILNHTPNEAVETMTKFLGHGARILVMDPGGLETKFHRAEVRAEVLPDTSPRPKQ